MYKALFLSLSSLGYPVDYLNVNQAPFYRFINSMTTSTVLLALDIVVNKYDQKRKIKNYVMLYVWTRGVWSMVDWPGPNRSYTQRQNPSKKRIERNKEQDISPPSEALDKKKKQKRNQASPGRLELPTSWLTVRRASRLRHGDLLVEERATHLNS